MPFPPGDGDADQAGAQRVDVIGLGVDGELARLAAGRRDLPQSIHRGHALVTAALLSRGGFRPGHAAAPRRGELLGQSAEAQGPEERAAALRDALEEGER